MSISLHSRGIPGALAVKLLSRALKQTELTRCVTNVQLGKQLQQRPRACGPVISAVACAPPGSVSTPTEKHIDDRDPSDHDGSIDVCVELDVKTYFSHLPYPYVVLVFDVSP